MLKQSPVGSNLVTFSLALHFRSRLNLFGWMPQQRLNIVGKTGKRSNRRIYIEGVYQGGLFHLAPITQKRDGHV